MTVEAEKSRILIIDDVAENINILAESLSADYDISMATTGPQGLSLAQSRPPDLILLDILMPEMDGFEVCERLKAMESTREIPVIFITAKREIEAETRGFLLGAVDFISKPIHPSGVRSRVQTHLELKRQRNDLEQRVQARTSELTRSHAQLKEREIYLESILNNSLDAILTMNAQGDIMDVNPAAEKIFGWSKSDFLHSRMEQLIIPPAMRQHHREGFLRYLATGESTILHRRVIFTGQRANGETFPVELSVVPMTLGNDQFFTTHLRDISHRVKSEAALREKTSHLDNILRTAINISIITSDLDFRIIYFNPTAEQFTGLKAEAVLGRRVQEIHEMIGVDLSRFTSGMDHVHKHGEYVFQTEYPAEQGGRITESRVSPIMDPEGRITGYILMGSDVTKARQAEEVLRHSHNLLEIRVAQRTEELERINAQLLNEIQERKHLEQQLRELAEFDSLTRLPNRKLFQDRLQQAMLLAERNQEIFALMFVDLDRFKWVNDTLGHDVGDLLLVDVANRLKGVIRKSDTVARLGGDEFTVIIANILHDSMAELLAMKILEQLSTPFLLKGQEVMISGSVGIALFPNDGTTVQTLVKHADTAMYQAKESGRNAFHFFSHEIHLQAHLRMRMEAEMRQGIINQEFFLDYQPKVNLTSGTITGMEALLRWDHPREGILFPKHFIPMAERTGMIVKIGAWALEMACREAVGWVTKGFRELQLAVNLSAIQFRDGDLLVELVMETLRETGFPAHNLELEITESMLIGDTDQACATLTKLRDMGITITMDDFGTGHSSLALLKKLPIQVIKIDRSFVEDLTQDSINSGYIAAILSMARELNLHVILEGVESMEQLEIIKIHDGNEVQGFLFSPPLGKEAFCELLHGTIPMGGGLIQPVPSDWSIRPDFGHNLRVTR